MLFTPELAKQIALEEKWQTRRPVKAGDKLITVDGIKKVVSAAGRTKHAVGSIRTVQYAYGKPCRWWHPEHQSLLKWQFYKNSVADYGEKKAFEIMRGNGLQKLLI